MEKTMATVNGSTGSDTITTGDNDDSISGNGGNDIIESGAGRDTVRGGDGADYVDGWTGDDSIEGNAGEDTLLGYDGRDTIDGGEGHDFIDGENDDDTLTGGLGNDTIEGGSGNDSVEGNDGADQLFGETGADTMDGGAGQDWVDGGSDDDSLRGGADADTVIGRAGNDTIHGDGGADVLSGHAGDDALYGGDGADSLDGGSGDDYFDGGTGDDSFYMARTDGGGVDDPADTDSDVVRFEPGQGHDTAFNFDGENDFVYIGETPEGDVVFTQIDADTWRLTFVGNSSDSLTLNFVPGTEPDGEGDLRNQLLTDAEYIPPQNGAPAQFNPACFTPRLRIRTPSGLRPIGTLKPGDLVTTADHGNQPVRFLLRRRFAPQSLRIRAALRPVVIEAGAFGDGLPWARMHVSRQHAFAARGGSALVRAAHVLDWCKGARIQMNRPNAITYIHLVLARHALVEVEGVWTETFYHAPGDLGANLATMSSGSADLPPHGDRCRRLLTRADLRRAPLGPNDLGRLDAQSAPSTRPAVLTASAPAGVIP
ncbi:Hint domain-containing protein [Marimonas sp. MJW-29]|uniref:Hint domain-containing protein n=1 Tax=Sulfitobacter sediminis TaxID=3234186 RepID=A0ABV3RKZ8_9RHOB